jgi:threonine/homoserine/homoserine lactone efflux protein
VEPLLFLMTSVVLGLSAGLAPGPLTTLVFRQTLRYGSREGVKVALAPLLTDGVLVLLAAFAIGRLSDLDGVFALISLVGALFLIWLSWDTWKISELRVDLGEENPGTILKSVGVNLLNPHPYVFWFTVGGPLVVQARDAGVSSLVCFLGGFFSCLVGAKMVLALLIGRYRGGLRGRVYAWTMRTLALLLLGFAVWMGWDGVSRLS